MLRQVENVADNPFVLDAWEKGAALTVHGWCYSLATGLVNDLGTTVRNAAEAAALRRRRGGRSP